MYQFTKREMGICTAFTSCAVCNKRIGADRAVLGFPDLVPMFSDFGEFYDGCAHQACLDNWSRRDEFVAYFNELVETSGFSSSWRLVVLPSGSVCFQYDLPKEE